MTSWENSKERSKYHFDYFKNDPQVDKVIKLGKIVADYSDDVKQIITNKGNITDSLKKISRLFSLESCDEQVIVQLPGQIDILHIDQLQSYSSAEPWRVMRIHVALTDWEQGHFYNYGNYNHQQWHAGDVTTFDWQNLPYSTANAGHNPRITFQLTGILTERTTDFINRLKRFDNHRLHDTISSW